MFDFKHTQKEFWAAMGYDKSPTQEKLKAMNDFAQLYGNTPAFQEALLKATRSSVGAGWPP